MDSTEGRRRRKTSDIGLNHVGVQTSKDDLKPPNFVIDLLLPPIRRYQHVAKHFKTEIAALPFLFDELVQTLHPNISVNMVKKLAHLLLRRLHSTEQTEEIRGIQQVTGINIYLLVSLNVLLDLLMGCTSGGVRTRNKNGGTKMLHFRTLDWGMDALRKVIVHLDFVQSPEGEVIASSITYAGFVGVLTGVRKGLSMSLNFRPCHDASSRLTNFRFYWHHLLVLLGLRPSTASSLRRLLLPSQGRANPVASRGSTLEEIGKELPGAASTAAYLIFSDGDRTITMEKDHHKALVSSSTAFIVVTNHDDSEESHSITHEQFDSMPLQTLRTTGMDALLEDSTERRKCMTSLWEHAIKKQRRISNKADVSTEGSRSITKETLFRWMQKYPITNEETHFAAVMDPKAGKIVWIKRYLEPFVQD